MGPIDTRPVGPSELDRLADLFTARRNTRHCWCMAFCSGREEFTTGWLTGGNRRRFEAKTVTTPTPMGVLASLDERPVGWAACGPRSRYAAAASARPLLRDRNPAEDDTVWLLPCLVVHPEHQGRGLTTTLIAAAVELARQAGASALEGWPSSNPVRRADDFVGRRSTFERLGFTCIGRPTPNRAIMRLALADEPVGGT